MNLQQPFRAEVERIGAMAGETFDFLCAKINGLWNIQHTETGGHKDITASSLIVTKGTPQEIAAGTASGTISTDGAGPHTFGGSVVIEDANLVDSISDPAALHPSLTVRAPTNATGTANYIQRLETTATGAGGAIVYGRKSQSAAILVMEFGDNPDVFASWTFIGTGAAIGFSDASGSILFADSDGIIERNRSAAMGNWTNVNFNAADFTASGGATWTLTAPDQVLWRYMLIGKTMFVEFQFDTTSVSVGAPALLQVKIPGGFTAAQSTDQGGLIYNDAGAGFVSGGNIITTSGSTILAFQPGALGVGTWTVSVNATYVRGKTCFEVQ